MYTRLRKRQQLSSSSSSSRHLAIGTVQRLNSRKTASDVRHSLCFASAGAMLSLLLGATCCWAVCSQCNCMYSMLSSASQLLQVLGEALAPGSSITACSSCKAQDCQHGQTLCGRASWPQGCLSAGCRLCSGCTARSGRMLANRISTAPGHAKSTACSKN